MRLCISGERVEDEFGRKLFKTGNLPKARANITKQAIINPVQAIGFLNGSKSFVTKKARNINTIKEIPAITVRMGRADIRKFTESVEETSKIAIKPLKIARTILFPGISAFISRTYISINAITKTSKGAMYSVKVKSIMVCIIKKGL